MMAAALRRIVVERRHGGLGPRAEGRPRVAVDAMVRLGHPLETGSSGFLVE